MFKFQLSLSATVVFCLFACLFQLSLFASFVSTLFVCFRDQLPAKPVSALFGCFLVTPLRRGVAKDAKFQLSLVASSEQA